MEKTPEQVKLEIQIKEYVDLITRAEDIIKLTGHQPTLHKIRKAYKSKHISKKDVTLVCTRLAEDLQGEEEPFKSHKDVYKHMYPKPKAKLTPAILTAVEQASKVGSILGSKKKKATKKAKPATKTIQPINKSALPASLRHLV